MRYGLRLLKKAGENFTSRGSMVWLFCAQHVALYNAAGEVLP